MKFGVSSYSYQPLLRRDEISLAEVFDQIAAAGGSHFEVATITFARDGAADYQLFDDPATCAELERAVQATGLVISGVCVPASFIEDSETIRRAQIEQVKRYVDFCATRNIAFLRTDVVPWGLRPENYGVVETLFPRLTEACREIAEHAEGSGVTVSIENHGFLINASERCRRLVHAVDHPSFRMTLDIGNFLCVDEDPLMAVQNCLDIAGYIHLKDFLLRGHCPGPGWLETLGGRHIVGTVFGFGDLPVREIADRILADGFDGFVSLEFEGNEPTLMGCNTGLANAIAIFDEVRAKRAS